MNRRRLTRSPHYHPCDNGSHCFTLLIDLGRLNLPRQMRHVDVRFQGSYVHSCIRHRPYCRLRVGLVIEQSTVSLDPPGMMVNTGGLPQAHYNDDSTIY
jgi:hypothetical protein